MLNLTQQLQLIVDQFAADIKQHNFSFDELTITVKPQAIKIICDYLCNNDKFKYCLIDLCGVDYLDYGKSEWQINHASAQGFSRGVHEAGIKDIYIQSGDKKQGRFAVVYHLLSLQNNSRLRIKTYLDNTDLQVDSVTSIWNNADWYEREAFDLFGIVFLEHKDLRRILTDYGFIGYPFRKDFPLSGNVEVIYDEDKGRVVYQPVSIEPRTLEPKVIRETDDAN